MKNFCSGTVWVVVLFVLVSRCSTPDRSPEVNSILLQREKSNLALAALDTAAIAAYWTDDYHIISSRNAEASGRRANAERFAAEFKSKPDVFYRRTPDQVTVFNEWNMASEFGNWVGHWTEDGKRVELKGTYFAKWHKLSGEWKIRAEIFVPLSCTGGKICDEGVKLE